jgi:hypothetical protein
MVPEKGMDKEVSIVLSREVKNYRRLAQEWYGLRDDQMLNMDVHHNPSRSEGGRNIPEHLFVYHYTVHEAVHEDDFVGWARAGSHKAHSVRDEFGRSVHAVKCMEKLNSYIHLKKDEQGKSLQAVKAGKARAEKTNSAKNENGKCVVGLKAASVTNSQRWEDPDHPELGITTAGALANRQKALGIPHGPENRRRVYPSDQ